MLFERKFQSVGLAIEKALLRPQVIRFNFNTDFRFMDEDLSCLWLDCNRRGGHCAHRHSAREVVDEVLGSEIRVAWCYMIGVAAALCTLRFLELSQRMFWNPKQKWVAIIKSCSNNTVIKGSTCWNKRRRVFLGLVVDAQCRCSSSCSSCTFHV